MVRPTDREAIATKEEVFTHSPLCGETTLHVGPRRQALGWVRNRREEKCGDQSFDYDFHGKEWIRQGGKADPV